MRENVHAECFSFPDCALFWLSNSANGLDSLWSPLLIVLAELFHLVIPAGLNANDGVTQKSAAKMQ